MHHEVTGDGKLQGKYFRLNVQQGMGQIRLEDWKKDSAIMSLAPDYMDTADMIRVKIQIASCLLTPQGVTPQTLSHCLLHLHQILTPPLLNPQYIYSIYPIGF